MAESIDPQKDAKDIIAWNIAIEQAYLNLTCMEANISISSQKAKMKHMERHHLAGEAHLEYQFGDPVLSKEEWENILKESLAKTIALSNQRMKKMEKDLNEKKKQYNNEIDNSEKKITEAKRIIEDSMKILNANVPYYDMNVVGDFKSIRKMIDEDRTAIHRLSSRMNTANLYQRKAEYNREKFKKFLEDSPDFHIK